MGLAGVGFLAAGLVAGRCVPGFKLTGGRFDPIMEWPARPKPYAPRGVLSRTGGPSLFLALGERLVVVVIAGDERPVAIRLGPRPLQPAARGYSDVEVRVQRANAAEDVLVELLLGDRPLAAVLLAFAL